MASSGFTVEFNNPRVLPGEQPEITRLCGVVRDANRGVLSSSNLATVYVASNKWWHKTDNDPKEHVTVRYNRRLGGDRVHIYRDGTANLNPQKPPRPRRMATAALGESAVDEEGSDWSVIFSDEEDEESPEPTDK